MKAALISLALASLLAACGGGGGETIAEPPVAQAAPAPVAPVVATAKPLDCTVDLYGDSIMAGWYLPESPAAMFRRMRTKYTVNDHAQGGEQAVRRAPVFDGGASRFVVIEHGVNDAARGLDLGTALRQMIRMAKAEGRTVIVTGLSQHTFPLGWVDAADTVARQVAAEEGAHFANWHGVAHQGAHEMFDETHPGSEFMQRLVVQLITELDKLAPECGS